MILAPTSQQLWASLDQLLPAWVEVARVNLLRDFVQLTLQVVTGLLIFLAAEKGK